MRKEIFSTIAKVVRFPGAALTVYVALILVGTPPPYLLAIEYRTPFNGTPSAFVGVLLISFATVLWVFLRKRPILNRDYFLAIPIMFFSFLWCYQENLFDYYSGVQEYGVISNEFQDDQSEHIGVLSASLMEDYFNGKSNAVSAAYPVNSERPLFETVQKIFPASKGWRCRRILVRYVLDAGYVLYLRMDSNKPGESAGVYAFYHGNPKQLRVAQCLFRSSGSPFVTLRWRDHEPAYGISSYGLFRAFEGSIFRPIALGACMLWSIFGLWRILTFKGS